MESDFPYAAHRTVVAQGDSLEVSGTRFPLALVFLDVAAADLVTAATMGPLVEWLGSSHKPFTQTRLLLLVYGPKPTSLRPAAAASLAACLLRHGAAAVELCGVGHVAEYAAQCAATINESRRRRVPSRFEVAGRGANLCRKTL